MTPLRGIGTARWHGSVLLSGTAIAEPLDALEDQREWSDFGLFPDSYTPSNLRRIIKGERGSPSI
eukprot:scaffold2201_cov162-Skeletonema_marinoi.AAC.1